MSLKRKNFSNSYRHQSLYKWTSNADETFHVKNDDHIASIEQLKDTVQKELNDTSMNLGTELCIKKTDV